MKIILFVLSLVSLLYIKSSVASDFNQSVITQDRLLAEKLVSIFRDSYKESKESAISFDICLNETLHNEASLLEEILFKHHRIEIKYILAKMQIGAGLLLVLYALISAKFQDRSCLKSTCWIPLLGGLMFASVGYLWLSGHYEDLDYYLNEKVYNLYKEEFATLRRFSFLLKNSMNTSEWKLFTEEILT